MTAADRDRVRELVSRSCAAQGIDVVVPPEVAAQVARLVAGAQSDRAAAPKRAP